MFPFFWWYVVGMEVLNFSFMNLFFVGLFLDTFSIIKVVISVLGLIYVSVALA